MAVIDTPPPPAKYVAFSIKSDDVSASEGGFRTLSKVDLSSEHFQDDTSIAVSILPGRTSGTSFGKLVRTIEPTAPRSNADRNETWHNFSMESMARIEEVSTYEAGWAGPAWAKPDKGAVTHARAVISSLSKSNIPNLSTPFVSADYTGDITMEWWNGPKKLTLYISENSIEYVTVWGGNMDTEMGDGEIKAPAPLLRWLYRDTLAGPYEAEQF